MSRWIAVLALCALAGCKHADAEKPGDGKQPEPPPATPAEPAEKVSLSADDAKTLIADALKKAGEPSPDCDEIADTLVVALPIAYPKITEEAVPAYKALQICALETHRWRAALKAGLALRWMKPDEFTVAQIVRALGEMGEYDLALQTDKELLEEFPEYRESLVSAQVFTYCRGEIWDRCEETAEAALAEFTEDKRDPKGGGMVLTRFFRDLAWVVTGKPKDALEDLGSLEKLIGKTPAFMTEVEAEAEKAIQRGFYLDVVTVPQLATGVYHLMGRKETGALVTLKFHEHTGAARTFRVDVEVPGVTEQSSNSLDLGANAAVTAFVNPPLKIDFDVAEVRSPRPAELALTIVEETTSGVKTILDETIPIDVLPRDYLPMRRKIGADAAVATYGYLGAWITPNDPAVDDFLTKAKARLPKHKFVGEQGATVPQVRAIFDELKARGVSYVMDPAVSSTNAFVQRTRLPADVLSSTNAQCLEGTLAFATLMEAIGLRPLIVIVPGHSFVGWRTVPADNTPDDAIFLETTMVSDADFDAAMKSASHRFEEEVKAGSFKSGAATLIDVAEIRKLGFTAQPF